LTKKKKLTCPVKGCSYPKREEERGHPKPKKKIYASTRAHGKFPHSKAEEDAYRDFDGWDVNEELARLRLAIQDLCASDDLEKADSRLLFIINSFSNIDECLTREGDLPDAWQADSRWNGPVKHLNTRFEMLAKEMSTPDKQEASDRAIREEIAKSRVPKKVRRR